VACRRTLQDPRRLVNPQTPGAGTRGLELPDLLVSDYQQLPSHLPAPQDDGAADHLPGLAMPYSRRTLIATDGRIEHAFHPIFPPDEHAAEVLGWRRGHAAAGI
jgi:hypothetical protein